MVTDHIQHDEHSMIWKQNKHQRTDHDRNNEMSSNTKHKMRISNKDYNAQSEAVSGGPKSTNKGSRKSVGLSKLGNQN